MPISVYDINTFLKADTDLANIAGKTINYFPVLGYGNEAPPFAVYFYNPGIPNPLVLIGFGALTSQRINFVAVWLPKAATITGVKWIQSANGSYTASNYNGVGLYTYSGGT